MTSPAATERAALLELLSSVGPDAPTVLDGWRAHELAAHLVARERRPQALPGILVPALHGITEHYERQQAARPFSALLGDLDEGPPLWSAARWSQVGELHEWFVHHEDVRRAVPDAQPRGTDDALEDGLWARLALLGPACCLRASGLGIVLEAPGDRRRRVRRGGAEVVVRGLPSELTLWAFGRDSARVSLEGAVDEARAARIGL